MTDLELLELAAKSASLIVWKGQWPQEDRLFASPKNADANGVVTGVEWNPLLHDDDAFRLAVKLEFSVYFNSETVSVSDIIIVRINKEQDRYAAVRRAIVEAAALI